MAASQEVNIFNAQKAERHSEHMACNEDLPGAAVEHTCVEEDARIPSSHGMGPLLIDDVFVVLVVFVDNPFPVILRKEFVNLVLYLDLSVLLTILDLCPIGILLCNRSPNVH